MQSSKRKNLTSTAEKLASLSIYVDKLHIKGHTDPWCLQNCDPRKVDDLDGVWNYVIECVKNGLTIHLWKHTGFFTTLTMVHEYAVKFCNQINYFFPRTLI